MGLLHHASLRLGERARERERKRERERGAGVRVWGFGRPTRPSSRQTFLGADLKSDDSQLGFFTTQVYGLVCLSVLHDSSLEMSDTKLYEP